MQVYQFSDSETRQFVKSIIWLSNTVFSFRRKSYPFQRPWLSFFCLMCPSFPYFMHFAFDFKCSYRILKMWSMSKTVITLETLNAPKTIYSDAILSPSPGFVAWLSLKNVCSIPGNKTTEIRKCEKFFQVLLKYYDCLYLICIDIIPTIAQLMVCKQDKSMLSVYASFIQCTPSRHRCIHIYTLLSISDKILTNCGTHCISA